VSAGNVFLTNYPLSVEALWHNVIAVESSQIQLPVKTNGSLRPGIWLTTWPVD